MLTLNFNLQMRHLSVQPKRTAGCAVQKITLKSAES